MKNVLSFETKLSQAVTQIENKYSKTRVLEAGEKIFDFLEPQQNIYFSLNGIVKLFKIDRIGNEIAIALLPEKSFFGLSSLLLDELEQKYSASAVTPVKLISTPTFRVRQELHKSPELSSLMIRQLVSRLLNAEITIEFLRMQRSQTRLVSFLLILSRDFGIKTNAGIEINLRLSHETLAEMTSLSRVSVTKFLGQLRHQQMISIYRQKITIHDPKYLRQYYKIPDLLS
ncbi:Crp/Fnr family transcriptional regulator [Myxosarcina sp. GI1]|uniref:Crp/Fnr family transcriptional regulator n=1 Tax=Myxosarcina sp. GI1 TaxID=1541065 RepID=UPI00055A96E9|nr:Crp/Fnr family transcriptional regulator [Myxosarcina sp. GI1]